MDFNFNSISSYNNGGFGYGGSQQYCCGELTSMGNDPFVLGPPSDEAGKKKYVTGSVKRYCDLLSQGVEGTPQMVLDIINDLRCVFNKTFGTSKEIESKNNKLAATIASLREEIAKLEECKTRLQQELCRIQGELIVAQKAYDDEVNRRLALENLLGQLRMQINRLETTNAVDAKEKMELAKCVKSLEARLKESCNTIDCLKREIARLVSALREVEDHSGQHYETLSVSKGRCSQLEEALARCCRANEELQKEICQLRKERDCLQEALDKIQSDLKRISEELETERQSWFKERAALEKTVHELKETLDAQTLKNRELCDNMNKITTAHHQELDCLRKKAENYCILHEQEKAARERLEQKLRQCEEKQLKQIQFLVPDGSTATTLSLPRSPCADIAGSPCL